MLQVAICDDDRAALERYAAQLARLVKPKKPAEA